MLGVLTSTIRGGPCERIVRGPADRRDRSASAPVGDGADDRDRASSWRRCGSPTTRSTCAQVMARAGEAPEVVLEATYGWYWAADTLAELGAHVHLAHPLGVKMFSYRRVKNDERDAADLADLLRMGRLPEAWIAPPATRELRGWVRHRAKLVGLRSSLKCQVHAVLAARGVQVPMSDLFGVGGQQLLATRRRLAVESRSAVDSLLRLIDRARLRDRRCSPGWSPAGCARDPGYTRDPADSRGRAGARRRCSSPRSATSPASPGPQQLASWAGLTPKHHESDTTVHRGRITKQGIHAGPLGRGRGRATRRRPHPARAASGTGSPHGAAATSASSPPPASCSPWSSTGCAITTSAALHPRTTAPAA